MIRPVISFFSFTYVGCIKSACVLLKLKKLTPNHFSWMDRSLASLYPMTGWFFPLHIVLPYQYKTSTSIKIWSTNKFIIQTFFLHFSSLQIFWQKSCICKFDSYSFQDAKRRRWLWWKGRHNLTAWMFLFSSSKKSIELKGTPVLVWILWKWSVLCVQLEKISCISRKSK